MITRLTQSDLPLALSSANNCPDVDGIQKYGGKVPQAGSRPIATLATRADRRLIMIMIGLAVYILTSSLNSFDPCIGNSKRVNLRLFKWV